MIYLATPYTHPSKAEMQSRFETAACIAGMLMQQGHFVFCPITHTHPIAVACELPRDFEYWRTYDEEMLSICDELWVIMMDGWRESRGIAQEVGIAAELELPIHFFEYHLRKGEPILTHNPQTEKFKCQLVKI